MMDIKYKDNPNSHESRSYDSDRAMIDMRVTDGIVVLEKHIQSVKYNVGVYKAIKELPLIFYNVYECLVIDSLHQLIIIWD